MFDITVYAGEDLPALRVRDPRRAGVAGDMIQITGKNLYGDKADTFAEIGGQPCDDVHWCGLGVGKRWTARFQVAVIVPLQGISPFWLEESDRPSSGRCLCSLPWGGMFCIRARWVRPRC